MVGYAWPVPIMPDSMYIGHRLRLGLRVRHKVDVDNVYCCRRLGVLTHYAVLGILIQSNNDIWQEEGPAELPCPLSAQEDLYGGLRDRWARPQS